MLKEILSFLRNNFFFNLKNNDQIKIQDHLATPMNPLIFLEDYGITVEVWTYLTVNDIISLLSVSKDINNLTRRINKIIPQNINFQKRAIIKSNTLKQIFINFPNISKLTFHYVMSSYFSEQQKIHNLMCELNENDLNFKNIKELQLFQINVYDVNFPLIKSIVNYAHLTSLSLISSNLDDDSLSSLISLKNLSNLDLSKNIFSRSTDYVFLKNLPKLTTLNISDSSVDLSILNIHLAINLTSLDISKNSKTSIEQFMKLKTINSLKILNISNCRNISDNVLLNIVNIFNNLTSLNMMQRTNGHSFLTNLGLSYLKIVNKIKS